MLVLWRKSINHTATPWQRATTEKNYLIIGRVSILSGIAFYVVYIYQVCNNWQTTPVWFYFLSAGLILGGICLIQIWRKSITPIDLNWDNILKNYYFILGIVSIICGLACFLFGVNVPMS